MPAFQRRRGRAQDDLGPAQLAAVQGQVARRIAGAFLLLVAGVVLLVDHDQCQPRQRGQHRHPRAQHDARAPAVRRQPGGQALRRRQPAVQGHHGGIAKARGKTRQQLRRQVDLGHQHQHLRIGARGQGPGGGAHVDLGLAAAGGAEQQEGAGLLVNLRQSARLVCGKRFVIDSDLDARRGRGRRALQAPRHLHAAQAAQLRRQGGQRHLAQRALVVARGEGHQLPPFGRQRRQAVEHAGHGAHLRRQLGRRRWRVAPHHAQHLARAQRHAHDAAGGQRCWAGVRQRLAQPAVRRGGHGDAQPVGHALGRPWRA